MMVTCVKVLRECRHVFHFALLPPAPQRFFFQQQQKNISYYQPNSRKRRWCGATPKHLMMPTA
jgi:hypothetical protein